MTDQLWPGRGGPAVDYISAQPDPLLCSASPRSLVILGSTGSIGRNALSAIDRARLDVKILALAAGSNVALLAEQASLLRPPWLGIQTEELGKRLQALLPAGYAPHIVAGQSGYATLAALPEAGWVLSAQAGAAGLVGTLAAVFAGKAVALANKESLVLAGALIRKAASQSGAAILPVDSEHFAIFQCLAGRGQGASKILLTASGGPFFGWSREQLSRVRAAEALAHPNWKMGARISIDSATLMNKGLEVIEAVRLFGIKPEAIQVLAHPQSIVHSLVQFADNSILSQLAVADMRLPIAAALAWPNLPGAPVAPLDLASCGPLCFYEPDYQTFPSFRLALRALAAPVPHEWQQTGLNPWCIILNAANEAAVELFLQNQLSFTQIPVLIEYALDNCHPGEPELITHGDSPVEAALACAHMADNLDLKARQLVSARHSCKS